MGNKESRIGFLTYDEALRRGEWGGRAAEEAGMQTSVRSALIGSGGGHANTICK